MILIGLMWLILVVTFGSLSAQNTTKLTFDGQVRLRAESDGRDFNSNTDINNYTLMRARLAALIEPHDDIAIYIQIQDSRAFGTEPSTLSNTANVDLHQGFFEIRNLWGKPLHLKGGRQHLQYGNERLIGPVGFSNVGRSFDAVKLSFGRKSRLDIFSALIRESHQPPAVILPGTVAGEKSTDFNFFGVYYEHRRLADYRVDAYVLYELDRNQSVEGENDLSRATLGTYSKGKISERVDFESEFAVQLGKRRGRNVRAFMLTGSVGYRFRETSGPHVHVGYDYLSGMTESDQDYKVFDTLFATNHKFYGFMDYFLNIPINTEGRGLQDFMVKGAIPFAQSWDALAHYHYFRAARGDQKNFGHEIDLGLNYRYNAFASLQLVLAAFAPGVLMENIFGSNDISVWSYLSLLVTF